MGVYKLSNAGGFAGNRQQYNSMLAGNPVFVSSLSVDYLVVAGGASGGKWIGGGGGAHDSFLSFR
jgi:hypothetical protein